MLLLIAVAFGAGVLTVLGPCTLPVLPLVLGSAAGGGRRRPLGVIVGFAASFLLAAIVLAAALAAAGVTTALLRVLGALVLGLAGAALISPRLEAAAGRRLGRVADSGHGLASLARGEGLAAGLVLGASIGLAWAPCVGPIMAGVLALSVVAGPTPAAIAVAAAYVAGAALPLAAVAILGRRAVRAAPGLQSGRPRRALGLAMLLSAALVATSLDVTATAWLTRVIPVGAPSAAEGLEAGPDVRAALEMLMRGTAATPAPASVREGAVGVAPPVTPDGTALPPALSGALPAHVPLDDLGPAPEPVGIKAWLNTTPLTMAALRGRVVLVEFWTYACINCQHVQPDVIAWEHRYRDAGLVVLAIHTPELSFERELANVRAYVEREGIRYPVAFDPEFATWSAYRNAYWPAMYFVDRSGRIRHVHVGEGDAPASEQVIRQLLAMAST